MLLVSLWVHPHYLIYFNPVAGGPANGYRLLTDSNVDWGQDLLRLKSWMVEHDVESVKLGWFGTADPDYYDITHEPLPGLGRDRYFRLWWEPPFNIVYPGADQLYGGGGKDILFGNDGNDRGAALPRGNVLLTAGSVFPTLRGQSTDASWMGRQSPLPPKGATTTNPTITTIWDILSCMWRPLSRAPSQRLARPRSPAAGWQDPGTGRR